MDTASAEATVETGATFICDLERPANPAERTVPERAAPERAAPEQAARDRLIDLYESEFLVIPADRPERRRAAHGLRYQVYCVENAFEDAATHPDGMEADEFDGHSVHHLLQRRADGAAIGTVRLILPVESSLKDCLPFSRLCQGVAPHLELLLPLDRMAEVSRFCISKELRRRPGGQAVPGLRAALSRYATLGLIRGLLAASLERGIAHWCLVVEPPLLRFLAGLGFHFEPLGPLVDYHGLRQPCHSDLATLIEGVRIHRPDVWEVITDDGRLVPQPAARRRPAAARRRLTFRTPIGAADGSAPALAVA